MSQPRLRLSSVPCVSIEHFATDLFARERACVCRSELTFSQKRVAVVSTSDPYDFAKVSCVHDVRGTRCGVSLNYNYFVLEQLYDPIER